MIESLTPGVRAGVDSAGDRSAESALATQIRRRRTAAGLSQSELARRAGFSREYVSRAERPSRGLPSGHLVAVLDEVLGAEGALVQLWRAADSVRSGRRGVLAARAKATRPVLELWPPPGDGVGSDLVLGVLDPVDALEAVETCTRSVIDRYEIEGPSLLAPEVLALRGICRDLRPRLGSELRRRATSAAAQQAALLAYMSVNLDRHAEAARFAFEAFLLASAAKDQDLLAWVKGTQSFAAYYQGRYRDALQHAQAGLQIAGQGPQRVRLLSNGVARAAGKLGKHRVVERAVEDALQIAGRTDASAGMTPCIAFGAYDSTRTVANAATAYLSVGRYAQVLDLTATFDVAEGPESDWSRALVRLDRASALARSSVADLDHAADVGVQALAASRSNPIASISRRGGELAADLALPGREPRRAEDFCAALDDWRAATGVEAKPR